MAPYLSLLPIRKMSKPTQSPPTPKPARSNSNAVASTSESPVQDLFQFFPDSPAPAAKNGTQNIPTEILDQSVVDFANLLKSNQETGISLLNDEEMVFLQDESFFGTTPASSKGKGREIVEDNMLEEEHQQEEEEVEPVREEPIIVGTSVCCFSALLSPSSLPLTSFISRTEEDQTSTILTRSIPSSPRPNGRRSHKFFDRSSSATPPTASPSSPHPSSPDPLSGIRDSPSQGRLCTRSPLFDVRLPKEHRKPFDPPPRQQLFLLHPKRPRRRAVHHLLPLLFFLCISFHSP